MNDFNKRIKHTLAHMKDRCFNPKCKAYKDYGARGISVCDKWTEELESFVDWSLSHGYKPGLAIDRINNDGNYEPSNCRWVTPKENNQNRRSSRFYTINGERHNVQQWCDMYGLDRSMVEACLNRGWSIEYALHKPKRTRDTNALIGERFGRLVVQEYVGVDKYRYSLYRCLCDCGNTVIVNSNKLKTGHNQSCGCLKREICYAKK